ncbi:MAG: hypothetical protein WC629_02450 [Candidatus Paceibacterota bacterium]|jgi:hypothetical protein
MKIEYLIKPNILSEIFRDMAQVVFGTLFVSYFVADDISLLLAFAGVILSVILWIISLGLGKN